MEWVMVFNEGNFPRRAKICQNCGEDSGEFEVLCNGPDKHNFRHQVYMDEDKGFVRLKNEVCAWCKKERPIENL